MERSSVDMMDVLGFVRVVETGAFARAAERMGVSKSILSRRVARLEDQLGARLLTRSAQGTQPTDIGQAYFERASAILADLDAAQEIVADAVTQVAGPIRMSAPLSFGTLYLGPALAEFALAHPRVELDVSLDDRAVDLVGGGYDLAIRIGRLPDSALIARRIAPVRAGIFASPAYLDARGRPQHPADLNEHDLLLYANVGRGAQWRFRVDGKWHQVQGANRFRADNGDLLREAACAGLGIVMLPTFIASPAIASGALEIVLREYPLEDAGLHVVMPPGRATTARVRALVDFLARRFGPEPEWDPCWMAPGSERTHDTRLALDADRPESEAGKAARRDEMAKGQKKSNKEIRKPKKEVKKTIAAKPSTKGLG